MAVIQISRIQVRRGLSEDLPQLASGELGWSIDTRQLFIGNGTLDEGAPVAGITEILTAYSNGADLSAIKTNVTILQSNVSTLQANVATLQSQVGFFTATLADNTSTLTNTAIIINSLGTQTIDYNIVRGTTARVGTLCVTQYNGGNVAYQDDYSETANTGVILGVSTFGNIAKVTYVTTSTGSSANVTYYVKQYS